MKFSIVKRKRKRKREKERMKKGEIETRSQGPRLRERDNSWLWMVKNLAHVTNYVHMRRWQKGEKEREGE